MDQPDTGHHFTQMRYQMSPFYTNLMGLNRAVEDFLKKGSRVGDNKATKLIVFYAEELHSIDQGVIAGELDQLGFSFEQASK